MASVLDAPDPGALVDAHPAAVISVAVIPVAVVPAAADMVEVAMVAATATTRMATLQRTSTTQLRGVSSVECNPAQIGPYASASEAIQNPCTLLPPSFFELWRTRRSWRSSQ
jgi:hypothetical protein